MTDLDNLKIFGEAEGKTIEQMKNCMTEDAVAGALMADNHYGYSMPVGGVIAYKDMISPSGVGYDVACGNLAVKTNINFNCDDDPASCKELIARWMDEIYSQISFGVGQKNGEIVEHDVLEKIREANFEPQRDLYALACQQLGTVGSGNHYVDLFLDSNNYLWIGVHFGSRGFGHKTASGFLAMANGGNFGDKAPGGEMDAPPTLFSTESGIGQAYIEAMNLAGEYAYAGREWVCDKVLSILGAKAVFQVHNHHNFAWPEKHFGEDVWVVRKGATPAFLGQRGFVGGSMGDISVILAGDYGNNDSGTLCSTVHGAGRVMSRTAAAGKFKMERKYTCNVRDCDNVFDIDGVSSHLGPPRKGVCPDHPESKVRKIKIRVKKRDGIVDWDNVTKSMSEKGIELRGAGADEAPEVYKRIEEVLAAHEGQIKIEEVLTPVGVAMAGNDVFDPFKN